MVVGLGEDGYGSGRARFLQLALLLYLRGGRWGEVEKNRGGPHRAAAQAWVRCCSALLVDGPRSRAADWLEELCGAGLWPAEGGRERGDEWVREAGWRSRCLLSCAGRWAGAGEARGPEKAGAQAVRPVERAEIKNKTGRK